MKVPSLTRSRTHSVGIRPRSRLAAAAGLLLTVVMPLVTPVLIEPAAAAAFTGWVSVHNQSAPIGCTSDPDVFYDTSSTTIARPCGANMPGTDSVPVFGIDVDPVSGHLVAVGGNNFFNYSDNGGASWTSASPSGSTATTWNDIAYNGYGKWMAVGDAGHYAFSSNGTTFTQSTFGSNIWQGVDGNGINWVRVGGTGNGAAPGLGSIQYSYDNGATWTSATNPSITASMQEVEWIGDKYIATGSGGFIARIDSLGTSAWWVSLPHVIPPLGGGSATPDRWSFRWRSGTRSRTGWQRSTGRHPGQRSQRCWTTSSS